MQVSLNRFVVVAACAALLISACGSDGAVQAAKGTIANDVASTEAAAATTVTTESPAETEPPPTAAPTTTTEAPTTTVAAPAVAGPADGVPFVGVDGFYTLLIGPTWADGAADFPAGTQGWFTGQETVDFAENVNVLTEPVPSFTPLSAILDASVGQIEAQFEGFTLIRSEVVAGATHPELGLLEYSAVQDGIEIRFVQVFGVWNDNLVVFTGSTDGRSGEEGADRLRPYALTLAPTG